MKKAQGDLRKVMETGNKYSLTGGVSTIVVTRRSGPSEPGGVVTAPWLGSPVRAEGQGLCGDKWRKATKSGPHVTEGWKEKTGIKTREETTVENLSSDSFPQKTWVT